MGDGLHFSLSNLPERYRAQAAQKLYGDVTTPSSANPQAPSTRPQTPSSKLQAPSSKHRSPIRMTKKGDGPNKTEAQFNRDVLLGKGKYEALTLHLTGGVKYSPDWVFEADGVIYLVETKGSYHLPTHGRSVMAFKIACTEFPMFTFLFAELGKDGRTWTIGRYRDGQEISTVSGTAAELHEME